MDGFLSLVATAVGSAAIGGVAVAWFYMQRIDALRQRLDKVEQARAAAHERSAQARVQINQLSHAIAGLQRRHRVADDALRRREELERLVPSSPAAGTPAHGFADTQPM